MANETAGQTTPEKSTRRCQVTDNEKKSLRVLLAEQKIARERKAAARRGADPKHGPAAGAAGRILSAREMVLVRRLCRLEPFMVTPFEADLMESFARDGIVKHHQDGTTELTMKGADLYIRSCAHYPFKMES